MKAYFTALLFCFVISGLAVAQTDSLVFVNGNYIVGEVKGLDRGVLTIETSYSDSDFSIEWSGVEKIFTTTNFLITLSNGDRYNGRLATTDDDELRMIVEDEDGVGEIEVVAPRRDLVFLKAVDSGFWSQFYASVDFGFSYTKANNLKQTSLRSNFGYLAQRWGIDLSSNFILSVQDEVDDVRRIDAALSYRYYLPKDWFAVSDISFLSNTEQKLDLRTNGKIGMGKYLVHTNRRYFGVQAGASFNNEKFSTEASAKQSLEAYFGSTLNLFDIGDLSLLAQGNIYPGITEKGRLRADFKFDAKYDLPLDFYIKFGFTINYDNQPVEGATDTDYVVQSTVGWEL